MPDQPNGHSEPCAQAGLPVPVLLKGQRALITGASSGIGRAVAIAIAAAGADVAVNYVRGSHAAQEVVETIRTAGGP